ncbi:methylthioribulose 1-phosphate dehydratase [Celerinatantimonas yamalensis]|uniref:Methylthioribulose-1-phosphate dehydratase n=1 Tax=Celerinatantimonas yamalensis TaxID=559956 RepID=A0ABW9G8W4_9GAMM
MKHPTHLDELINTCHWLGQRGFAPATGGNMSIRADADWCWISASGKDKGSLESDDFISVRIADNHASSGRTPSAETGLHTLLYRLYPQASTVLHVHSVNATVLSRLERRDTLTLQGYEMQKTLQGQTSHLDAVSLPIYDNDQDIDALAKRIAQSGNALHYGFLLRGHGLTTWGETVAQARRQLEGLEFLFECDLRLRALEKQ